MKLNYFSSQTLPKLRGGGKTAKVSFGKSGSVLFNPSAVIVMSLKPGDKLTLAQDEDEPSCWYFFKDEQNGFEVKYHSDKKSLMFSHAQLIRTFNECFGFAKESKSHLIAGQPTVVKASKTEYWGLLVSGQPVES